MSDMTIESQHESGLVMSQKNSDKTVNDVNKNEHLGGEENMAGSNAVNEPLMKKVKLTNDTAMMETPKIDNEHFEVKNFDKERSPIQTLQDNGKAVMKGISVITKTAKAGEPLLKETVHADGVDSERRLTRSQTRGDPVPPPLQKRTPRQETSRRGRRGRPRKEENRLLVKNLDHHEEGSSIKECDKKKEVALKEVNDVEKEEKQEINLIAQKETSITESESLTSQN